MSDQPQLPVHPLIANQAQGGQQPEPTVKFAGYVGQASQQGLVRLYSSLDDLSQYAEFDAGSVVQTADAPESLLPNNGILVFVTASTPVRWITEYPSASAFVDAVTQSLSQAAGSAAGSS